MYINDTVSVSMFYANSPSFTVTSMAWVYAYQHATDRGEATIWQQLYWHPAESTPRKVSITNMLFSKCCDFVVFYGLLYLWAYSNIWTYIFTAIMCGHCRCSNEVTEVLMKTVKHNIEQEGILATRLCTHKEDVHHINKYRLKKITSVYIFALLFNLFSTSLWIGT